MNTKGLKFQKMWEAADTLVFDIEAGSILPIIKTVPRVASFSDKHWLYYYENGIGAAYYEESDMRKAAEAGLNDFSDYGYRERYFSEVKALLESEERLYQKIAETSLSDLSNGDLKNLLQQSIDVLVDNFGYYLACQPQCVSLIERSVQERLRETIPADKIIEAFTLLSTPTAFTKIKREERDWLDLIIKTKKEALPDYQGDELTLNHYKKYFLLNAADGHEPWSLDYFTQKFLADSRLSLPELEDRLSRITNSLTSIEQQKKDFIDEHSVRTDIVNDCNLLAELGHWRLEMRFVWMPGYYYDKLILNEVARRFSCDATLIRFATITEIFALFKGTRLVDDTLKSRGRAFLFCIEDGTASVLSGEEAKKKFLEQVPATDTTMLREFKGNIAMKGRVTARALVYKWGDDMQERLASIEGDFILVAGQTRPQLMPLILKSKGIVTDEGGITSHAAIVSRELGIPCVIGTKIATQTLKNGDLVEVDADNGIVKILDNPS